MDTEQPDDHARGWRWPGAAWLLALLPLGLFFAAGWRGLDFGTHWDQEHRVRDLTHAFGEGTLLPDDYNYPSVTFDLTLLAAAPKALEFVDADPATEEFEGEFMRYLLTNEFQVRLRAVFLFVSSLAILWVFATLLAWRKRPWEALVGALLLAGSFEVGYHARWVAPDAVLMQFGALCLLACVACLREPGSRAWLRGAAVAAGLAAGTKYTGGVFLVPVLLVAFSRPERRRAVLGALALFGVTFLVTTPGALLEPTQFVADVRYELLHYSKGHWGYTVEPGREHLTRNLRYLLVYGPSHWPLASLVVAAFGIAGVAATWRESRLLCAVLLVVPALFVPYLSLQKVMFVRNLLLVMPVGALFAARGVGAAWDALARRPWRVALVAAVSGLAAADLGFALHAAQTIHDDGPETLARAIGRHLERHTDRILQLSPNVRTLLLQYGVECPEHVRRFAADDSEAVVLFPREVRTQGYWPSNDPDLKVAIGPLSANYDYYSTWWTQHVIVIDRDALHEIASALPRPGIGNIFPDLEPPAAEGGAQSGDKAAGKTPATD